MISIICKFSKRITLIEGVDTWTAKQWVQAFLKRLDLINWDLPDKLITDRDSKFLSKFWTALFDKLGVKLLYSTAYHPQTDGSSKRINQTIEIALRFFVHALKDQILCLRSFHGYNLSSITHLPPQPVRRPTKLPTAFLHKGH